MKNETTNRTGGTMYQVSKIREGQWGIFFNCSMGSFGPKGPTFRTKREAERKAATWNSAARMEREENA